MESISALGKRWLAEWDVLKKQDIVVSDTWWRFVKLTFSSLLPTLMLPHMYWVDHKEHAAWTNQKGFAANITGKITLVVGILTIAVFSVLRVIYLTCLGGVMTLCLPSWRKALVNSYRESAADE